MQDGKGTDSEKVFDHEKELNSPVEGEEELETLESESESESEEVEHKSENESEEESEGKPKEESEEKSKEEKVKVKKKEPDNVSFEEQKESFIAEINRLSGIIQEGGKEEGELTEVKSKEDSSEKTDDKTEKEQTAAQTQAQPLDFAKALGEDFDFTSSEGINKLANLVYNTAIQQAMRVIPGISLNAVNEQQRVNSVVDKYFSENDDLSGFRPYVGTVAMEVARVNPNKPLNEVFEEAGNKVRETLKLKIEQAKVEEGKEKKKGKGEAPGTGSRSREGEERTGIQKEIDNMIETT